MDLADLLAHAAEKGYSSNFSCEGDQLRCADTGDCFDIDEARVVDSRSVDQGTDPGDDATLYLIETRSGRRGFIVVGDSFHADPRNALFIDRLIKRS